MSFQAQVVNMNEELAFFDMEFTVPRKQIKKRFFIARIFEITLYFIISGRRERMKKGEETGQKRREQKPYTGQL